MSTLSKAPSVRTLTAAWTRRFSEVVQGSAGKDGRLSLREAARIADRFDGAFRFSEDAVNYLESQGQKTIAPAKLIAAGKAYVETTARVAAGGDGRLSGVDQSRLPQALRDEVRALQGRSGAKPSQNGSVFETLTKVTSPMRNASESESPVIALSLGQPGIAPVTAAWVAQKIATDFAQHAPAMAGGERFVDTAPLAQQPVSVGDANVFLAHRESVEDSEDPGSATYAGQWQRLGRAVRSDLSDLQLFRFGTVEATYVLVGRTATGDVVGFMAGAVET